MAINTYLQKCDYRLGGLQNYIYIIRKEALKINIKAKGIEVFWKAKQGDITKVNGALVVYSQEETNSAKYRFQNKLEVTVEEQYEEPFLYALRTLRTNQYYIIIEDKKGIQYLVNPELNTNLNYEYLFKDSDDATNNVLLTFFNLCNFPLLIMKEKIDNNLVITPKQCEYNIGKITELVMLSKKDLKVNDDGVLANNIYVSDLNLVKRVDYLKDSCSIIEEYNNKEFKTTLKFSIPLDDNQFNWHYDLLEYQDNKYCAIARTSNNNYIILGVEIGLSPKYNIQTSEDAENPNVVEITFTQISQYPIIYTNEILFYDWREDGAQCFGFDRYQMLSQYYTDNWGDSWQQSQPIIKKKGKLLEKNSAECTEVQWIDADGVCQYKDSTYDKWSETSDYLCDRGNKYKKTRRYTSTDKVNWTPTNEYGLGALIEENSEDCRYIAIRWVEDSRITCAEVDESKTKWEFGREECDGTDYVRVDREMVTNNSIDYYPTGVENKDTILIPNCCACGYYQTEDRFIKDVCDTEVVNDNIYETNENNITITRVEGNWIRKDDEFTSNQIWHNEVTIERIYFTSNNKSINLKFIQSSEHNYDYLIVSKIDTTVVNDLSSSNNFGNAYGKTDGSFVIPAPTDGKEHFIELMYRKDRSNSYYNDNVIVTFNKPIKIPKERYTKYALWETFKVCDDGHTTVDEVIPDTEVYYIKERNSCDCGYRIYEFKPSGEFICGDKLTYLNIISSNGDFKSYNPYTVSIPRDFKPDSSHSIYNKVLFKTDYNKLKLDIDIIGDYTADKKGFLDYLIVYDIDSTSSFENINRLGGFDSSVNSPLPKHYTIELDVPDSELHYVYFKYYYNSGSKVKNFRMCDIKLSSVDPTSKYEKYYQHALCPKDPSIDEIDKDIFEYRISEKNSCDCGYVGYEYRKTDYICGSELNKNFITRVEGNWIREGNTFTSNKIYKNETTIEKIYFKGNGLIRIDYDQDSEIRWDYAYIYEIDSEDSINTSLKFETTGSITLNIPDNGKEEHFIKVKYQKDSSGDDGRDNVILTFSLYDENSKYEVWEEYESCSDVKTGKIDYRNPVKDCSCGYRIYEDKFDGEYICGSELGENYDIHSKYEIWHQHALCPDDPSIDEIVPNTVSYRNPVKSYDCGYQTYQWRIEEAETCGNAIPKDTPIVSTEPEINVDKPYNDNGTIQ